MKNDSGYRGGQGRTDEDVEAEGKSLIGMVVCVIACAAMWYYIIAVLIGGGP